MTRMLNASSSSSSSRMAGEAVIALMPRTAAVWRYPRRPTSGWRPYSLPTGSGSSTNTIQLRRQTAHCILLRALLKTFSEHQRSYSGGLLIVHSVIVIYTNCHNIVVTDNWCPWLNNEHASIAPTLILMHDRGAQRTHRYGPTKLSSVPGLMHAVLSSGKL